MLEKAIDQAVLDDVEGQLLSADVGLEATDQIVGNLREEWIADSWATARLWLAQTELQEILKPR